MASALVTFNPKKLPKPIHIQYISNLPEPPSDPVRYFLKTVLDDPQSWHADLQFVLGYHSVHVHKGDLLHMHALFKSLVSNLPTFNPFLH
jgi:hypothetical protein